MHDHVFSRGCVLRYPRQEEHDFARVPQQDRGGSSPSSTKKVSDYTSEVTVGSLARFDGPFTNFTYCRVHRDAKPEGVDITVAGE